MTSAGVPRSASESRSAAATPRYSACRLVQVVAVSIVSTSTPRSISSSRR